MKKLLTHLDWLESEAIHIMREVAGQCSNPVLLFSGVFYKKLTLFSASGIAIMMLAAAYFHFSVGDELIKALPSSVMLLSCLIIIYSSLKK